VTVTLANAQRASSAIKTFQPSPNFEPLWTETASRVLLRGPNRIGKTRHLCALAAQRAIDFPGSRVRFVAPTRNFVQTVAGRYLAEFLAGPDGESGGHLHPRSYFVHEKGWNGGMAKTIILANGSVIQLLSYQDPPSAHEGDELDMAVLDEPPPFAHLMATQTRLMDRPGAQLFIGATMVNRPDPALREMVEGPDETPKEGRTHHSTGWVQYVGKLSACPWKTPAQIEAQLEILRASPWDYAQRAEGAWEGVTAGRWFNCFSDANCSHTAPEGSTKVALSFDHGEQRGRQCHLLAFYRGPKLWIWAEYRNVEGSTTPEKDVFATIKMLQEHRISWRKPGDIDYAVGDTNTAGKGYSDGTPRKINDVMEATFAEQSHRRTSPFAITVPNKTPGAKLWAFRMINYACDRGDLVVHPRCVGLLDTLRNWKGKSTGDSDDAKLAHAADALAYLAIGTLGETPTYSKLRFY
jgi:hypothetical protein